MNVAIRHSPSEVLLERAEVDVAVALVDERRRDHEAEGRQRHDAADHRTEAERRRRQERAAAVPILFLARGRQGNGGRRAVAGLRRRRLHRRRLRAGTDVGGGVADPERAEGERQDRAEDDDAPADDEAEQEDGDADGESDRPETRWRDVRPVVRALRVKNRED